ncbi:lachesin-like [Oppia nitens]|uniref:lachesin-like n=1 Tax=Oppia nitens TaxID=1686743 RepID=UPI0023DA5D9E|nr:lachesin-like [Oppia nitens]
MKISIKPLIVLLLFPSFGCIEDDLFDGEELPEFGDVIPNITVPIGRESRMPCVVNNLGSYRAAWLRVEEKDILTIHHHVITRNYRINLLDNHNDNRNFILVIKNVQESDRGGYMCQINTVPMKSQIGYLDVLVPPDILINETSNDVVVNEGSDVSLRCRAKGYPPPEITWRREDGERIPLGDWQGRRYITNKTEGENLNITRVTRVHSGAWLCIASNGVMPSVSKRILLHVQFAPQIWLPSQTVGAPLGKFVSIDCHIEAYPPPVNYWINESTAIFGTNSKYEITVKERGYKRHLRLIIHELQESDLRDYHCFAKNALGEQKATIKLYAIEINEFSIKESLTNKHQSFNRNNNQKYSDIYNHNNKYVNNKNYLSRQSNHSVAESTASDGHSCHKKSRLLPIIWSSFTHLNAIVWT